MSMRRGYSSTTKQHQVGCSECPWREETYEWDAERRYKAHTCTPPPKETT